jgi:hypothetical protein
MQWIAACAFQCRVLALKDAETMVSKAEAAMKKENRFDAPEGDMEAFHIFFSRGGLFSLLAGHG